MTTPADLNIGPTESESHQDVKHDDLIDADSDNELFDDNIQINKVDQFLRHALGARSDLGDSSSSPDQDNWLATSLPDRFEVKKVLGRGTFGVVYLVHDQRLLRDVAVKALRPEWMIEPTARGRFLRESRAAARLNHTHIVRVLEADENPQIAWQVRDAISGDSLSIHLKNGPLPVMLAARWLAELSDAVGHAHRQGILHRDIKPDNILIDAQVGTDLSRAKAYLTDFGLAKLMDEELGLSRSGTLVGTPRYMAPELFEPGSNRVQTAGDIYSLGAVLYECLSGSPPFENAVSVPQRIKLGLLNTPLASDKIPNLNKDIVMICSKAMSPEVSRRYASAIELADDLNCFLRGLPIQARPLPYWEQLFNLAKQNRKLFGLSVALVASLLIIAIVSLYSSLWISRQKNQLQNANNALISQREKAESLAKTFDRLRKEALTQQELYRDLAWNSSIKEAYQSLSNGRLRDCRRVLNELLVSHPAARDRLEWRLLNLELSQLFTVLLERAETFSEIRSLPQTSMVVVSSENGRIYILDTQTASLHTEYAFDLSIHALAVHPKFPIIAIGGSPDAESDLAYPTLVDLRDGTIVKRLEGLHTTLESLQFSGDGQYLLCASRYDAPKVYDWNSGQSRDLVGDRRNNWAGWLDETNQFIYQAGKGEIAAVASRMDSNKHHTQSLVLNPPGYIRSGTAVQAGAKIAVYDSKSDEIRVLDAQGGLEVFSIETPLGARITCLESSSNGHLIAAGSERGEVSVWRLPEHPVDNDKDFKNHSADPFANSNLPMIRQIADSSIRSMTFEEEKLICCTESGMVVALDLSQKDPVLDESDQDTSIELNGVWETAWAETNGDLAVAREGGMVYFLNRSQITSDSIKVGSSDETQTSNVLANPAPASAGPKLDRIAVQPFLPATKKCEPLFTGNRPISELRGIAVSSKAALIAWPVNQAQFGLCRNGHVQSIDAPRKHQGYEPKLAVISALEERQLIAVQGEHYFLRILSALPPCSPIQEFDMPGNSLCAQWHSDGERLFVGGNFDSIAECHLSSGKVVTLRKVASPTNSLRIMRNSNCIASAHDDGSIRISGLSSSRNDKLSIHNHPVRSIATTSDERLGISVDDSGMVALWTLQPLQSLGTLFNANDSGSENIKVYPGIWLSSDDRTLSIICNGPDGPIIRTWMLSDLGI